MKRKYQTIAIISMIAMVVMYALTQFGFLGPMDIGRTSDTISPLIVPSGYAFAIWGIIYLGLIIFPLYQWFNRFDNDPLWNKVRTLYSINVILNGLWLVFASYEYLVLTLIVIIFMLITLYMINQTLVEIKKKGNVINFWMERFVFSIYFAWITLATVLNVSIVLKYYNWSGLGITDEKWTLIMMPIAALIAGVVALKYRNRAYASVVIWAFIALIVKHMDVYPNLVIMASAIAAIFLGLIVWITRKLSSQSN